MTRAERAQVRLSTVGIAGILLLNGGCSGPTLEESRLAWDDPPQHWQLVQEMEVGVVDGPEEYALTHVDDVMVDDAGHLYSLHGRQESTIRVFGSDGGFVRWIGSEGDGPGEFRRPIRMGWQGDRLWVLDSRQSRVSLFGTSGDFLRGVDASPPSMREDELTRPHGLLADGRLVGSITTRMDPPNVIPLDSVPIVRWDAGGQSVDTLVVLDQSNRQLELGPFGTRGGGRFVARQPFSEADVWTVAPDGATLVVVKRSTPGEIRVLRISVEGDTMAAHRYEHRGREISEAAVDDVIDRWTDVLVSRGVDRREARAHVIERVHVPEHLPAVSSLMAATDGRLWLGRWEEPLETSPRRYTVVGPDGEIAAVAEVPEGVRVLAAADDHAWGVREDELGVPYLVRLRIERDSNRD